MASDSDHGGSPIHHGCCFSPFSELAGSIAHYRDGSEQEEETPQQRRTLASTRHQQHHAMHGGSELWKVPLFSCSSTFHSYSFHASFRPLCMNTVPQLGGDGAQRESRRRRRRRRHTHTTADRRSLRTLPLPPALHKKTRGTGEGQPICTRSIRVALRVSSRSSSPRRRRRARSLYPPWLQLHLPPFSSPPQLPLRHASPARSFCCLCGTLTTTTLQGGFQTRCLSEPRFSFLFFFCCGSSTNKLKHALPSVWNQDENG